MGAKMWSNRSCNLLYKILMVLRLWLQRLVVVVESPALLIGFQFSMETRVSTINPTPLVPAPSFSQLNKELSFLYVRMVKTNASKICVGLSPGPHLSQRSAIQNSALCAEISLPRACLSLRKDWTWNIEQTCRDFLTALKLYQKGCAHHLRRQADYIPWGVHPSSIWENKNVVDKERS